MDAANAEAGDAEVFEVLSQFVTRRISERELREQVALLWQRDECGLRDDALLILAEFDPDEASTDALRHELRGLLQCRVQQQAGMKRLVDGIRDFEGWGESSYVTTHRYFSI